MTGCSLRKRCAAILAGLLLMAMSGCGGTRSLALRSEFIPFTAEQAVELQASRNRAYRIQEGDLLSIRFAYEKSLDQDRVVVLSDGSVSLVGVDTVRLAGLTMSEADSILTAAYSKEYREPSLSVMMLESQGRRVYVLGEVSDPGQYSVPGGGIDVMSAIVMASGFKDDAAREATIVVRITPEGYQVQEVDLSNFGKPEFALSTAFVLRPYDIVYVPRSRQGDFGYFSRTILSGLSYVTRIAYDLYNVTSGNVGRY